MDSITFLFWRMKSQHTKIHLLVPDDLNKTLYLDNDFIFRSIPNTLNIHSEIGILFLPYHHIIPQIAVEHSNFALYQY